MNFSSNGNYSTIPSSIGPSKSYRRYADSKMQHEKKALETSYKSVINAIEGKRKFSTPSHKSKIVYVKSAPIESDSDSYLDTDFNFLLRTQIQSHINKTKLSSPLRKPLTGINNGSVSSKPQLMSVFNEFDSSLNSLQNEILEIKSFMMKNSQS